MGFTPFGKYLHKLRREHDEVLYHMAKRLGETTPTVSNWQVGGVKIRPSIIYRIIREYDLNTKQALEIWKAFDESPHEYGEDCPYEMAKESKASEWNEW